MSRAWYDRFLIVRSLFYGVLAFSVLANAYAAPEGGAIRGGSGRITQSELVTLIQQHSDLLAIDWTGFDVGAGERVDFVQPGLESIALNRVITNNPSQIFGQLNANGHVILANPHGIHFGSGASVNVGGLIAAGMDIRPDDFMNGDLLFSALEGRDGRVVNQGLIRAATGGSVGLLGKQVVNEGVIVANLGAVHLAAGTEAVATFDNRGLLGIRVTEEVLQEELGMDPAVLNSGELRARGGRVAMSASVSRDLFSQAVNTGDLKEAMSVVVHEDGSFTLGAGADTVNTGTVDVSASGAGRDAGRAVLLGENVANSGQVLADADSGHGGDIELHAADTTSVMQTGTISARSESHGRGGRIKLLGNKVGLFDQSVVDASGAEGGGEILIGGDRRGMNEQIRNAEFVYLGRDVKALADGLNIGNGGKLIAFAEDTARIYGGMSARGGSRGGDGGFIETSGLRGFEIDTVPDTGASHGRGGEWLIDPYNITVVQSCSGAGCLEEDPNDPSNNPSSPFAPAESSSEIEVGLIYQALLNGDVEISTVCGEGDDACANNNEDGNIAWGVSLLAAQLNIDGIGAGRTLTLDAANNIEFVNGQIFDGTTSSADNINLVFDAVNQIDLGPTTLNTYGGSFTSESNSFVSTNATINTSGSQNVAGGLISITANSGDIAAGDLNASAGSVDDNNPGLAGGNIDLVASGGSITVSGAITTNGSNGERDNGTAGRDGGNGGAVTLTAGNALTVADVFANGGNAASDNRDNQADSSYGTGGAGGDIALNANSVTLNGDLSAVGGEGDNDGGTNGTAGTSKTAAVTLYGDDAVATLGYTGDFTSTVDIQVDGAATGSPTLVGSNRSSGTDDPDTEWTIDAAGGGSLTGNVTFTGIETLRGNNQNDLFVFQGNGAVGRIEGDLDGTAADDNTIDTSALAAGTTWTLDTNTAFAGDMGSGTRFLDIQTLVGSAADGDEVIGRNQNNKWSIIGDGSGTVAETGDTPADLITFRNMETLTGNVADDLFEVAANVMFNGTVDGFNGSGAPNGSNTVRLLGGTNTWTLDSANALAGDVNSTLNFEDVQNLEGAGSDILIGRNIVSAWEIDGAGAGLVSDLSPSTQDTVDFSGMADVRGGNLTDVFGFATGFSGSFAGTLSGGGGADTFNLTRSVNTAVNGNDGNDVFNIDTDVAGILAGQAGDDDFTINVTTSGTLDGGDGADDYMVGSETAVATIRDVDTDMDADLDELVGFDTDNTWSVDAQNQDSRLQTVAGGDVTFQGVEVLQGGAGGDGFRLQAGDLTYTLRGGEGAATDSVDDTITAYTDSNAANAWTVDGIESGSVGGVVFEQFEILQGGDEQDIFSITAAFSGTVLGGAGEDTFRLSADPVNTVFGEAGDDRFIVEAADVVADLDGGGGMGDSLIGFNVDTLWTIDGVDEGEIDWGADGGPVTTFSAMESLTGGDGADTFNMTAGGVLTGTLDGGGSSDNTLVGRDTAAGVTNEWDITDINQGNLVEYTDGEPPSEVTYVADFQNIQNLTGGSGDDTFIFQNDGAIDGSIDAAGHDTGDTVDLSNRSTVAITLGSDLNGVSNAEEIIGNNTDSTLTGTDNNEIWELNDNNDGEIGGLTFIDFNNLNGGGGDDTFNLVQNASLDGTLNGGGDADTVDLTGLDSAITVGPDSTADLTIAGIETLTADSLDGHTLVGSANTANDFEIDQTDGGVLNGMMTFSGFTNLRGGNQNDTFRHTDPAGSISGNVDGRGEVSGGADSVKYEFGGPVNLDLATANARFTDIEQLIGNGINSTLTGLDGDYTWVVDGENAGEIAVWRFIDFNNLTGGNGDDTFEFTDHGDITGLIDGGAGAATTTDEVLFSGAGNTDRRVALDPSAANAIHITNIDTVNAHSNANNWFIGPAGGGQWEVDNSNRGSVAGVEFTEFNNLVGREGADTFTFTSDGNIDGLIDGGDGTGDDEIDIRELGAGVVVQLGPDNSAATVRVDGFETLRVASPGPGDTNTLRGGDVDNTVWTIDGTRTGIVAGMRFSNINAVQGGNRDDVFNVSGSDFDGLIHAGGNDPIASGGGDVVDYQSADNIEVTLGDDVSNGVEAAELIRGDNQDSTLFGADEDTVWTVNAANSGTAVFGGETVRFEGFNRLRGSGWQDTFNLDLSVSGTGAVSIAGGGGNNDRLNVTGGGSGYTQNYYVNEGSLFEQLVYANGGAEHTVSFDDLDVIQDDLTADRLTVNATADSNTVVLNGGSFRVDSGSTVGYSNKGGLYVLGGGADDTVRLDGDVNFAGRTVYFDTEAVNGPGRLSAGQLLLDNLASAGSAGNRLLIDADRLRLRNGGGTAYIDDSDSVELLRSDTDGGLDMVAGGSISAGADLTVDGDLRLQAVGSIRLDSLANRFAGRVDLDAGNAVVFENSLATRFGAINATSLTAASGGALSASGSLQISGRTALTASGAITLENADNDFSSLRVGNASEISVVDRDGLTLEDVTAGGAVSVRAASLSVDGELDTGSLTLDAGGGSVALNAAVLARGDGGLAVTGGRINQNGGLEARGGDIVLNAGGGITMDTAAETTADSGSIAYTAGNDIQAARLFAENGQISLTSRNGALLDAIGDDTPNLVAGRVALEARDGIGADGNPLDLQTARLDAVNGSGIIELSNDGRIEIERLHNSGDITLFNSSTIDVSSGSVDAGYDVGSIFMSTNGGNFIGLGPVPNLRTEPADITGLNGTFIAATGTFGTPGRPITLNIQDTLFIQAITNFTPLFPPDGAPNSFVDESVATVSSVESVTALTGSQLVEVESVSEIDPAVFTAIRNFNYAEIAIQLPPDQLYEDDLEEYRRRQP